MTLLRNLTLFLALFTASMVGLKGQVTIGSGIAPNRGALLDLKQETNGTSTRGLGLPRVELTTQGKLYPMLPNGYAAAEDAAHTGLVVFNVGETSPFCKGLYVWDSEQWVRLSQGVCMNIGVTPGTLPYFLSGQNGSTITPANLNIEWSPTTGTPSFTSTGGITFTSNPLVAAWTNPQPNVKFTPAAMTPTEVGDRPAGNPFKVKTGKLTFTVTDNGKTKEQEIDVKQVNKAILVDGKLNPAERKYTVNANTESVSVESNARWKLASITATGTPAVELLNQAADLDVAKGAEDESGFSQTAIPIGYKVTVGSGRARYNYLTFTDANPTKRFNDVILTVSQCTGTGDLTMLQYKNLWEEMYGLDPLNDENDQDGDITKNKNRVQWHYDQDGNIFFSALFGTERWMITNLATTKFANNNPITQGYDNNYTVPRWGYPNESGSGNTQYVARERLGRLYNWPAAINMGSNTAIGQTPDPGNVNQTGQNHGPIQGVCPDTWVLPTDRDWTNLMNILITDPESYSGNLYANRANTAETIKDMCEPTIGTGKSFSVFDGGFSALLAGYAGNGTVSNYGSLGCFWSASSNNSYGAWYRYLTTGGGAVYQSTAGRAGLFSVRCKK